MRGRVPVKSLAIPLFILLASTLLLLLGDTASALFRYERTFIADGEVWRLFSGHLVHLDSSHFFLNTAALLLTWYLVGRFLTPLQWICTLLVTALGCSMGLYLFLPSLQWYVGLSGVLHGLMVAGAIIGAMQKERIALILLIVITAKLMLELFYGAMSTEMLQYPVITEAHLYGAVSGAVCALWIKLFRQ